MEVREHLRGLRGRVKQRQRDGGGVTAGLVVRRGAQLGRHHAVDDHVQMRQLRAFRLPGRARRIKNDGGVVGLRLHGLEDRRLAADEPRERDDLGPVVEGGIERNRRMRQHDQRLARRHDGDRRLRGFRHRQLRRPLEAEHRLRIAVAQVIRNLARLQQHVQRHDSRAGLEDAEIHRRKIRQVRAQQRDVIAAPDARRGKRVGDLIGPRVELRIGEALVAVDERLGVGPSTRVLLEHRRQVQHGSTAMLTQLSCS